MDHGNKLQESTAVEQSCNSQMNVGNSCAQVNIDFVLKGGEGELHYLSVVDDISLTID
jgi:hypothetical protein